MNNQSFLRMALNINPPPCETFKCEYYEKCKTEHLSCEAFAAYIHSRPNCFKRNGKVWFAKKNEPTKKIYQALFLKNQNVKFTYDRKIEFSDQEIINDVERLAA